MSCNETRIVQSMKHGVIVWLQHGVSSKGHMIKHIQKTSHNMATDNAERAWLEKKTKKLPVGADCQRHTRQA